MPEQGNTPVAFRPSFRVDTDGQPILKIHFAVIVNVSAAVTSPATFRMGFVSHGRLRHVALAIATCVAATTSAQSTSTALTRNGLDRYPLALCSDGSPAAYYHEQVQLLIHGNVEESLVQYWGDW